MICGSVVVYSLFIVAPIVDVGFVLGPCFVMLYLTLGGKDLREKIWKKCQ